MGIDEYFGNWLKVIEECELYKVVNTINELYKRKSVMPNYKDIFKAFSLCKYDDCKVVILGIDCYPQKGVATGLAFGNKADTPFEEWSPSLKVLAESFRGIDNKYQYSEFDCTLEGLAKQGVLLLNSALTVEENKPGSHLGIWRWFITTFLINLSVINPGIVYILLGSQAQSFEKHIEESGNLIMRCYHPSYWVRIGEPMPSDVFSGANYWLQKQCTGNEINWFNLK